MTTLDSAIYSDFSTLIDQLVDAVVEGRASMEGFVQRLLSLYQSVTLAMSANALSTQTLSLLRSVALTQVYMAEKARHMEPLTMEIDGKRREDIEDAFRRMSLEDVPSKNTFFSSLVSNDVNNTETQLGEEADGQTLIKWLVDNIHHPYASSSTRSRLAKEMEISTATVAGRLSSLRKRIGWTRIVKKFFGGDKVQALEHAHRVFLAPDTKQPLDEPFLQEFFAMKKRAEELYSAKCETSHAIRQVEELAKTVPAFSMKSKAPKVVKVARTKRARDNDEHEGVDTTDTMRTTKRRRTIRKKEMEEPPEAQVQEQPPCVPPCRAPKREGIKKVKSSTQAGTNRSRRTQASQSTLHNDSIPAASSRPHLEIQTKSPCSVPACLGTPRRKRRSSSTDDSDESREHKRVRRDSEETDKSSSTVCEAGSIVPANALSATLDLEHEDCRDAGKSSPDLINNSTVSISNDDLVQSGQSREATSSLSNVKDPAFLPEAHGVPSLISSSGRSYDDIIGSMDTFDLLPLGGFSDDLADFPPLPDFNIDWSEIPAPSFDPLQLSDFSMIAMSMPAASVAMTSSACLPTGSASIQEESSSDWHQWLSGENSRENDL